jgi:homoserine kinase type II
MTETHAPMLEMLWEASDPREALETRFGFGDGAEAYRWVVTMLEKHYGVRVDSCDRIVISDHNALAWIGTSSGRMLMKWSVVTARFPRLAALVRLTAWLEAEGLPVSAPVATLDGRLQVEADGASLGLQREMDGDILDINQSCQVREAGAKLAELHDALAMYPEADQVPGLAAPSAHLADQINGWLDSCPNHVPATACYILRRLVADAHPNSLPTQLVHGDYRSANVLYAVPGIAAVIDFEEARFDHPIVELARSAVMLGTRFRDWAPVSPEVRATFLDGYQSKRRLTLAETSWWDALVLWYSLLLVPSGQDPTGWGQAALSQLRKLGEDA